MELRFQFAASPQNPSPTKSPSVPQVHPELILLQHLLRIRLLQSRQVSLRGGEREGSKEENKVMADSGFLYGRQVTDDWQAGTLYDGKGSVVFQRSIWLLERSEYLEIQLSGAGCSSAVEEKKSPSYQGKAATSDSEETISDRPSPRGVSVSDSDNSDSETSGRRIMGEKSSKSSQPSHPAQSSAHTTTPSTAPITAPTTAPSTTGIQSFSTGNPITFGGNLDTGVATAETAMVTVHDAPLTVQTVESTPIATSRRIRPPVSKISRSGQSGSKGKISGVALMQRDISARIEAGENTDNLTGILDMYTGRPQVPPAQLSTPSSVAKGLKRQRVVEEVPHETETDAGASASKISVSLPNKIEYITNVPHFDTKENMSTDEQEIVRQMTVLIPKFGSNLLTKDNELKQIREYALNAVRSHADRPSNYHMAFKNNVDFAADFVRAERGELYLPDFESSTPIVKEVQRNIEFLNTEAQQYYNFAKVSCVNLERLTSYNKELEARAVRMDKDLEHLRMENERLNNELFKTSRFQTHNEILTNFISETYSKYFGTYQKMFELWRDPNEANRNAATMELRSIRDGIVKRCGNVTLPSVPSSLIPPICAGEDEGASQPDDESPKATPTSSPFEEN